MGEVLCKGAKCKELKVKKEPIASTELIYFSS